MIANPAAASGVSHAKMPVTPGSIRPAAANTSDNPMKVRNAGKGPGALLGHGGASSNTHSKSLLVDTKNVLYVSSALLMISNEGVGR